MNRNVESHFAEIPQVDLPRSIFDRSSDHKTSFNVGELIPFFIDEVLPGDSYKVTTSKVVRLQTMLTPVLDNLYLDTYFFYVKNRLIWNHWKSRGEIIMILCNFERLTTVSHIINIRAAIRSGLVAIAKRNIQRIRKILITEKLIAYQRVSAER